MLRINTISLCICHASSHAECVDVCAPVLGAQKALCFHSVMSICCTILMQLLVCLFVRRSVELAAHEADLSRMSAMMHEYIRRPSGNWMATRFAFACFSLQTVLCIYAGTKNVAARVTEVQEHEVCADAVR